VKVKIVVAVLAVIAIIAFVDVGLSVRPQGPATPTSQGALNRLLDSLSGTRTLDAADLEASQQACVSAGGHEIVVAPGAACTIAVPKGVRRVALVPASGSSDQLVVTLADPNSVDQTRRLPGELRFNVLGNPSTLEVSCPGVVPCALDVAK
jgi:hypothetical protein